MAKIVRKHQKIFANVGYTGNLGQFGSYAEGAPVYSDDPDTLQALSNFGAGLGSALINNAPPAIQDMDGLGFLLTRQLSYLFQAGIPEYNVSATYYIGSLVHDGLGGIFISLIDDNINQALTVVTKWMLIKSSKITPISLAAEGVYNVASDDYLIVVSGTSGTPAPYVFLPAAATANKGRRVIVKKLITTASGELRVAAGDGTGTIDGAYPSILTTTYQVRKFISTGSEWLII